MTDPIDVSATVTPGQPQGQNMALERRPEGGAVGILRPADSLDRIAEAFKEYQQVCERILTADDYQAYEGKPRKKKSAWRKLATAFNVSTRVIHEEIERTDARHVLSASYTICAYTGPKDNPHRQFEAVGYCDINEKCCASSRGEPCHKKAWKGHYCCSKGCDGRKHWTHPDHDVKATAQTRASNRAIADLIGCGEVSAEELTEDSEQPQKIQQGPQNAPGRAGSPQGVSQHPTKASQANLVPKTPPPPADEQTRARMIRSLSDFDEELLLEYFRALHDPAVLLDTESLAEIPLQFVPVTTGQFKALKEAITDFANGAEVRHAFPPNRNSAQPTKPIPTQNIHPLPKDQPGQVVSAVDKSCPPPAKPKPHLEKAKQDPDWFWNVVITVPRKGEKKAEYDKHPDTIGSLYQAIQDGDGEAGRRLWGLAKNWECAPREFKGKIYQPTDADKVCREALDEFVEYEEANGGGEDELPM